MALLMNIGAPFSLRAISKAIATNAERPASNAYRQPSWECVYDCTPVLTGGCLCGAIRYRLTGSPVFVMQCYCRNCQLASGTGHTTIVGIDVSQLHMEGEPKVFTNYGDTGGRVNRHFCPTCGSRLFTSGDLPGPIRMFQAGTLDNPASVSPTAAVYLRNRIHWDKVDPALPGFQAMCPFEPPTPNANEG